MANTESVLKPNQGILLVSEGITKNYAVMAFFFKEFRPLRFDLDVFSGKYYILAESVLFDEIPEGSSIPAYTIEVEQRGDELVLKGLIKNK